MSSPGSPADPAASSPAAARRRRLRALRGHLRQVFGTAGDALPTTSLGTGWPALDHLLVGGGLPRGRLTAVVGGGATSLLHHLVATVTRAGTVAWLDPVGRLDATALHATGVDLAELIVVQPADDRVLLRAAAIFQRTSAVDLLVVDAPTMTVHQGQRLATLARLGTTALTLLASPASWLTASADLILSIHRAAWQQDEAGLYGTRVDLVVRRQRGGRVGDQITVVLPFPRPGPPLAGLPAQGQPTPRPLPVAERHGTR